MLPPLVLVARAALEGFVVLMSPMTRRRTVRTEMFDGFMVAPVGVGGAAIAIIPGMGFGGCNSSEQEKPTESHGCEHGLAENRREPVKSHRASRSAARAGFGMTSCGIKHLFGGNVAAFWRTNDVSMIPSLLEPAGEARSLSSIIPSIGRSE